MIGRRQATKYEQTENFFKICDPFHSVFKNK